jgi:hypothetical protein
MFSGYWFFSWFLMVPSLLFPKQGSAQRPLSGQGFCRAPIDRRKPAMDPTVGCIV